MRDSSKEFDGKLYPLETIPSYSTHFKGLIIVLCYCAHLRREQAMDGCNHHICALVYVEVVQT